MPTLHELACDLIVAAGSSSPDIIGYAHALYYHGEDMSASEQAQQVIEIREQLDKLTAAVVAVERRLAAEIAAELEEAA